MRTGTFNERQHQELSDEDLMTLVKEHDESAFEVLLHRHEDRIFHLAFRVIEHREDARDVTQEIFIDLWNNPTAWRPKAKFTTWLYRVTFNRALNVRRSIRFKSFFSLSNLFGSQEAADYSLPPASRRGIKGGTSDDLEQLTADDTPELDLTREEEANRFAEEFDRLHPRQRAALHLRYREGLPVSDVAKALGVSIKSAESLIFRGKRRLKEVLADHYYQQPEK